MYRCSAYIHRGYPRRSEDDDFLARLFFKVMKKRGLTGTGVACDIQVLPGMFH